ncbi:MAG TPA: hypothetical protein VHW67_07990 [Solirubrobacteraceae bacterium]|jgi:hypothetical protein|nr:hypothetical protein [Solirubrobacteraceae bacterium]
MAGTVIVPWYATGFRADAFQDELEPVAAAALRYGATSYAIYRAQDDRYKFQQLAAFEDKLQWDRYWSGPEMTRFRVIHSSWYQVPVLYGWWDKTTGGEIHTAANGVPNGSGNGHANGAPHRAPVEGESA